MCHGFREASQIHKKSMELGVEDLCMPRVREQNRAVRVCVCVVEKTLDRDFFMSPEEAKVRLAYTHAWSLHDCDASLHATPRCTRMQSICITNVGACLC